MNSDTRNASVCLQERKISRPENQLRVQCNELVGWLQITKSIMSNFFIRSIDSSTFSIQINIKNSISTKVNSQNHQNVDGKEISVVCLLRKHLSVNNGRGYLPLHDFQGSLRFFGIQCWFMWYVSSRGKVPGTSFPRESSWVLTLILIPGYVIGTAAYHTGSSPDSRTMATLKENGICDYKHRARKVPTSLPRSILHWYLMSVRCDWGWDSYVNIYPRFPSTISRTLITSLQWIKIISKIYFPYRGERRVKLKLCCLESMLEVPVPRRWMILTMGGMMDLKRLMNSVQGFRRISWRRHSRMLRFDGGWELDI